MTALVFADLHLDPEIRQEQQQKFFKTLDNTPELKELYLLGDIFDVLVGPYKFWNHIYKDFWNKLKELETKGVLIHWIEGNHDFSFQAVLNRHNLKVKRHTKSYSPIIHKRQYYMAHGDQINPDDKAYRFWRNFNQSYLFKFLLRLIPNLVAKKLVLGFARKWSKHSRSVARRSKRNCVAQSKASVFALNLLKNTDTQVAILGHSHVQDYIKKEPQKEYFNLGFKENGGRYLKISKNLHVLEF